jgi:hypothetical protein
MKNLHLIATDKQSRLYLEFGDGDLCLANGLLPQTNRSNNQHIYIISDEEIREGDYWIYICPINGLDYGDNNNPIVKNNLPPIVELLQKYIPDWFEKLHDKKNYKKIILTTDPDLVKDGVQAIDDEFLEWFIKNPSCEEVEVEIETASIQLPQQQLSENSYDLAFRWINKKFYKIIIPQEEAKQETLEEAAENYANLYYDKNSELTSVITESIEWSNRNHNFIEGARWQAQRSYSEEEVLDILESYKDLSEYDGVDFIQWFEQFKKK